MSIAIYYSFRSEHDLTKTDHLQQVVDNWDKEFDGYPYESWDWRAELEDGVFIYEGATKLPMDDSETYFLALRKALELLSNLRNTIEAKDWSVNLDDLVIPWDETCRCYKLRAIE